MQSLWSEATLANTLRFPITLFSHVKVKKTLELLGLNKIHETIIHKNTPIVNGMLRKVIHCIDIKVISWSNYNNILADSIWTDTSSAPWRSFPWSHGNYSRSVWEGVYWKDGERTCCTRQRGETVVIAALIIRSANIFTYSFLHYTRSSISDRISIVGKRRKHVWGGWERAFAKVDVSSSIFSTKTTWWIVCKKLLVSKRREQCLLSEGAQCHSLKGSQTKVIRKWMNKNRRREAN